MANHPLKLGYKASAEQFGPRPLLDFAVQAEEAGFDSVWISDHSSPGGIPMDMRPLHSPG